MGAVGPRVREVHVHGDGGAFCVLYVAQLADAVVVLHAFQKMTQRTEKRDLDLASARLRTFRAIGQEGETRRG